MSKFFTKDTTNVNATIGRDNDTINPLNLGGFFDTNFEGR